MSISAISGVSGNLSAQAAQSTQEAPAVQTGSRDSERDPDEMRVTEQKGPPTPTVNTSGQTVGQVINVKA